MPQLTEPVCARKTLGSENFQRAVGSTGHAHSTLNETSLITSKFRFIVAIQKFCYHGNVTSHFSSQYPLMKSLVMIFSMDCLLFKHRKCHFLLISASVEVLDEVEVEYITLPGWMTSIENCRTFSELPVNAQSYVRKIEEITQIPGQFIIKSMHTSSCFLFTKPNTLLNILV